MKLGPLCTTNKNSTLLTSYTGFMYLILFISKMHTHMHRNPFTYTASSLSTLRKFKPTQN